MDINNDELKKDLEEQYAMLEEEIQEDKKKKRYLLIFIFFLSMFLIIFGTTFSYYKLYEGNNIKEDESIIKNLYAEGYEDVFKFDPNVYKYYMTVKGDVTSLNIKYVLGNPKYTVDVIGNDELKPGVNEIKIIAKDEDGNEIEYIIYVTVEEIKEDNDLGLKNLSVTNHNLDKPFISNNTIYTVNDIKDTEDTVVVSFELKDNSNDVELKLNGADVTRNPIFNRNKYSIGFNVDTELTLGANKLEIIIKDKDGNENIYYLFLIVNKTEEDQKVIEISVDYGNDNGNYVIANIIPGWQSSEKQHIVITNNSNYNTNVDISFTEVTNNFVNTADLEYSLYKNNKIIKTGKLPVKDIMMIGNVEIPANSKNEYFISYRYIYSEKDQNIDQGKTFSSKIKVTLTK